MIDLTNRTCHACGGHMDLQEATAVKVPDPHLGQYGIRTEVYYCPVCYGRKIAEDAIAAGFGTERPA